MFKPIIPINNSYHNSNLNILWYDSVCVSGDKFNKIKGCNNMTPEELRNKAKELYKDHTALEVALILGKSEPTIRRWVKGITKEPSNKYKEVVDELLRIYEQDGVIASHKEAFVLEKSGITVTKSVKTGIRAQITKKLGYKAGVFTGKNEIVLHRTVEEKAYDIYRGMMYRCYDSSHPSYSLYGGKGVFVSEEWHDAEVFVRWYVENYVEDWEVDKDLFSEDVKHYSKETCVFLPAKLNVCLGQMSRTYSHATKSGTNYVKCIAILGRRVYVKGTSREEVSAKIRELKIKELVTIMNDERAELHGEILRKYDEVCLKICDKYNIPVDQLEHNLDQSPNKPPRIIPSRIRTDYSKDLEDSCY